MAVHADCYASIGVTHAICQDYALVDRRAGQAAVFLSDGCSSSPATDFGARFLTLAASVGPRLADAESAVAVVAAAWRMAQAAGLPQTCLDATLLGAVQEGDELRAFAYGDGVIAARRRDGVIEHVVIECPHGAPDYPSYLLDGARMAAYLAQTGGQKLVTCFEGGRQTTRRQAPCFEPVRLSFALATHDLVAVCSDGVRSFQRSSGTTLEAVPEEEVLGHALAIRSASGAFVVRRIRNGFLGRHCVAAGWKHSDDFSMGALSAGEP